MAGIAMEKLGLRSVIMSDPIHQEIGEYSVRDFWNRHLRWGRLRKAQALVPFVIEPLFGALISGVLGAIALSSWFHLPMAAVLLFHLLTWALCDLILVRKMGSSLKVPVALAWFARELCAFPLWHHIASGNTVQWRGRSLQLQPGGMISAQ